MYTCICAWVTLVNASCRTHGRLHTHESAMSVAQIDEARYTCEWIMSHTWMRHVSRTNASFHTYEWVTYTHEWVMFHTWMHCTSVSHATHICVSHTYAHTRMHTHKLWVMSCRGTRLNESCPICTSHVTHLIESRQAEPPKCTSPVPYAEVTSHIHESHPMWMSHISNEWVTSHRHASRPIWWVTSHVNKSRPVYTSDVPYESHTPHFWMSSNRAPHVECVTSHIHASRPIYMCHVPYTRDTFHVHVPCRIHASHVPYTRVTFHIQESRPIHMSHVPCECGMSWVWVSHITHRWVISHTGESCHKRIRPATHTSSLAAVLTTCCTLANHFACVDESCHACHAKSF